MPYPIPREFTGPMDEAGNRPTYRLREAGYAVSTEAEVETTMIGPGTIIHAGAKIGKQCMIGSSCDIGGNVDLQNKSSIGDYVVVSDSEELVAVGMFGDMHIMEKVVIDTSHESEG